MLIIAGALVGASGTILTKLMADAMNRSIATSSSAASAPATSGRRRRTARRRARCARSRADDVAIQLAYAGKVIIVPGYGLAAAQAQHEVADLAQALLEAHGVDVDLRDPPGRRPHAGAHERAAGRGQRAVPAAEGHGRGQPEFPQADVALVVGANDVTNPAARRPGNADLRHADPRRRPGHAASSSSSGRWATATPASTTSCTPTRKTGMFFADAKAGLTELAAAVTTSGGVRQVYEVRIHGRGGQGVVTAAELLSVAAFEAGRHAQAFPSFGSERTGAPVVAFCRIADEPIRLREPVAAPDALIVRTRRSCTTSTCSPACAPDGCVLINSR